MSSSHDCRNLCLCHQFVIHVLVSSLSVIQPPSINSCLCHFPQKVSLGLGTEMRLPSFWCVGVGRGYLGIACYCITTWPIFTHLRGQRDTDTKEVMIEKNGQRPFPACVEAFGESCDCWNKWAWLTPVSLGPVIPGSPLVLGRPQV